LDNLGIPSGDDMFLLKKAYQKRKQINAQISPNSLIYTKSEESLKTMFAQRLRWASKSGKAGYLPVFLSGLLILFANISCLIALVMTLFNSFYLTFCLFTLTLKFIIDFLLLFLSARMYTQKVNRLWFLPCFVFNLVYTPAITLVSFCHKPNWKGRKI